jgi:hypothetical protein
MQILNVGAGQTNAEYEVAHQQERADLKTDSKSDANYFFVAAGLAALGTGLLPIRLNFLVGIGAFDLLAFYGAGFGAFHALILQGTAAGWLLALLAMGFAARGGHRGAFLAGIVLYGLDMIVLVMTFSIWAFGVHAFFVFRWYQGWKALKDLDE